MNCFLPKENIKFCFVVNNMKIQSCLRILIEHQTIVYTLTAANCNKSSSDQNTVEFVVQDAFAYTCCLQALQSLSSET